MTSLALQLSNAYSLTNEDFPSRVELYDLFTPHIHSIYFAEGLGSIHFMRDESSLISVLTSDQHVEMIVCDNKDVFIQKMAHLIMENSRWITEVILPATVEAAQ